MARRHGNDWYVAGLNGTDQPMTVTLDLSALFSPASVHLLYIDKPKVKDKIVPSSEKKEIKLDKKGCIKVTLQPMGGVIVK